jgi:hypothetical protein
MIMLTVGWLAVAFGVIAMHWADGGFPSLARNIKHRIFLDRADLYKSVMPQSVDQSSAWIGKSLAPAQ